MADDNDADGGQCCCGCLVVLLNLTLGAVCFDYALWYYLGKDVPWWADMLCGLFLGEFVIPLAAVAFVLNLAGLPAPLIGGG